MTNYYIILLFISSIAVTSCGKKSRFEEKLPEKAKETEEKSEKLQKNDITEPQNNRFRNVKIKPDSTWEEVDLDDFPERLKLRIESDVNEARNKETLER